MQPHLCLAPTWGAAPCRNLAQKPNHHPFRRASLWAPGWICYHAAQTTPTLLVSSPHLASTVLGDLLSCCQNWGSKGGAPGGGPGTQIIHVSTVTHSLGGLHHACLPACHEPFLTLPHSLHIASMGTTTILRLGSPNSRIYISHFL